MQMNSNIFLTSNSLVWIEAQAKSRMTLLDFALESWYGHVNDDAQSANLPAKVLLAEETKPRKVDWAKYRGILKNGPDPVEFQRQLREEWE